MRRARFVFKAITLVAIAQVGAAAEAASMYLFHPFGEPIDRGPITVSYTTSQGRNACDPLMAVRRDGRQVTIEARLLPQNSPDPHCAEWPHVSIGELDAGWWTIVVQFYEADLTTPAERASREILVRQPGASCNRWAHRQSTLIVLHKQLSGSAIVERMAYDAVFAASLGSPLSGRVQRTPYHEFAVLTYPVLENPLDKRAFLESSGQWLSVEVNGEYCYSPPPGDHNGRAIEYHHATLDRYFYTAAENEIEALEGGSGPDGWRRTGESFGVLVHPGCPPSRSEQVVYRFLGKPGLAPGTHFFTTNREECHVVDRSGAWTYEGYTFWATPTGANGGCANAAEVPVYRLWHLQGTSGHRLTLKRAIVDDMTARGWIEEGIVMCVRP